jgi:hypothetical protein
MHPDRPRHHPIAACAAVYAHGCGTSPSLSLFMLQTARKYLGTIGLPGSVHEHAIHTLSGGQKSRVVLVELQLTKCHILMLDVRSQTRREGETERERERRAGYLCVLSWVRLCEGGGGPIAGGTHAPYLLYRRASVCVCVCVGRLDGPWGGTAGAD